MFYLLKLVTGMKQLMVQTQFTCMHYIFIWWLLYLWLLSTIYYLHGYHLHGYYLFGYYLKKNHLSGHYLFVRTRNSRFHEQMENESFLLKSTAVPSSPLFSQYQRRKAQLKSWQKIPCANPINISRACKYRYNTDSILQCKETRSWYTHFALFSETSIASGHVSNAESF